MDPAPLDLGFKTEKIYQYVVKAKLLTMEEKLFSEFRELRSCGQDKRFKKYVQDVVTRLGETLSSEDPRHIPL